MNLNKSSKLYITGHRGMVGSTCWKVLEKLGYTNLIGRTSNELDFRIQTQFNSFLSATKPHNLILIKDFILKK